VHVLLYTWSTCSHCTRAKELLDASGIAYDEQSLDGDRARRDRLAALFGKATMPYVMVDGEAVGGLPELERMLAAGELD